MQAPTVNSADRFIGTLWGAAIGDALGWPHEARAHRVTGQSKSARSNGRELAFKPWVKQSGGRFRPYLEEIEAGSYSDDTQLIIAVARARVRSSQWWTRLAEAELPFWTAYERGGGGATLRATKQLLKGELPWEARSSGTRAKYSNAGGNGVAMRIAPHCLANVNTNEFGDVARDILTDGVLTHGHPRALVGALAYGYCLWRAIRNTELLRYGSLIDQCLDASHEWSMVPDIADRWPTWASAVHAPQFTENWAIAASEQGVALRAAKEAVSAGALAVDEETLAALGCFDRRVNGAGTVNAAAAIFLASRHAASPIEGVRRAALAWGADTDTLASMTGALLGSIGGADWALPYVSGVQDHAYLRNLAEDLFRGSVHEERHRPYTPSRHAELVKQLAAGRTEVEIPIDGRATAVSHDGVRSTSPKVDARAWKLTFEGQSIVIKDVRERKAELPLEQHGALNSGSFSGIAINATDLDRACAFYRDMLGLTITRLSPRLASLGPHLALRAASNELERHDAFTLFIEVTDLRRCQDRLRQRGVPHSELLTRGGREAFLCRDPDGNLLEVMQQSPSAHGRYGH